MNCTKCGTPNDDGSKYCKECGERISDPSKTARLSPDEHLKVGEFIYLAYRESEAGHLDNAVAACQGALAINDGNPATHALLASLYERKGDLARAIYEYERVVSLNPGSLDDRRKLEQLRAGLLTPVGLPRIAQPKFRLTDLKWFRHSAMMPWVTAVGAFAVVVLIGGLLLRGGHGSSGNSTVARNREQARTTTSPNTGIPGHPVPYGPGAFGPNQPGAQQGASGQPADQQDQPANGNATPTAKQTRPGIPSVRVPGTAVAPQPPVKQPDKNEDNYRPIIVPVIPPTTKAPANNTEVKPVPPAKNAEQRGMELHRMGKYDDAIGAYKEALNQTSDSAGVYKKMAMSYQRLGQHDAAIDNYNRGIKAYRDQLASGRDKADVERNIRVCEAGIEVSRNMKQ